MDATWIKSRIGAHVTALAGEIGPRPSGSPANRLATDYLRMVLDGAGLVVDEQPFTCRWWVPGTAAVQIGGAWIDVPPAPFGRACDVRGRVARFSDDESLAAADLEPGRIVVIHGALTAEPYLPKAFPLLEMPAQRARLERLEALEPAVVIASSNATFGDWMLEDGDLAFPYVVVPDGVGDRMREGREAAVRVTGSIADGSGVNIAARSGPDGRRVVLSAHMDTKVATPGAFDNAGGVGTLLALAEAGLPASLPIELVFFNGEDHYQAPGETAWLATADLDGIDHVINLDGAGLVGHPTAVTPMACDDRLTDRVRALVEAHHGWVVGPEWYESDHAIFAMRGIPAIAMTSAGAHGLPNVLHTDRDTPRMVDPSILAGVAAFIEAWLEEAAAERSADLVGGR